MADQSTLNDLVDELALPPARIAIELNGTVIRRDQWPEIVLNEDDRLEIVHFVGGGSQVIFLFQSSRCRVVIEKR